MSRNRFMPNLPGIWAYLRDPGTNWKPKVLAVLAVVYLLWPLDLLPDIAPLLGWLDDLGFVGMAGWYLGHATSAYLEAKDRASKKLTS